MTSPQTIYISAKCHCMFSMSVIDADNRPFASYSGYVPSFMPNAGGSQKYLQMEIDIETGQILNWKNPIGHWKFNAILTNGDGEVPKTIYISAKCYNMFEMSVVDAKWEEIASHDGNVPSFLHNEGECGDYVQMEIDIETGEILNWKNPIGDSEFDEILEFGRRNPTTIEISAYCGDKLDLSVLDMKGECIATYEGFVPSFMSEFRYSDCVGMNVDIETGQILNWKSPIGNSKFNAFLKDANGEVPKTICLVAYCRDTFMMSVMNGNGKEIADYSGYVPSCILSGYGKYVYINIDIETGRVLNWKNPIGDPEFNSILKRRN